MKKLLGLIACAALCIAGASFVDGTAGKAEAKPQYINDIVGKQWNVTGRVRGTVIYNPNGTASYRTRWGLRGNGEWRRAGDRMCVRWFAFQGGREGCFTIQKEGPSRYSTSVGLTLSR